MGTISDLATLSPLHPALSDEESATTTHTTEIHLTGFSRFHNVHNNPTEHIANQLPHYLENNPLPRTAILSSSRVLKVSAETTRSVLQQMYSKYLPAPHHKPTSTSTLQTIFIHMGVNVCAKRFQLEIQARNEATFICPDELGWAPIKQEIIPDMGDISRICRTTLNVKQLVSDMQARGFDVEESTDAGRFVCNWVYFNSLALAQRTGTHALFVHVPPPTLVAVQDQVEFMANLMQLIAATQSTRV